MQEQLTFDFETLEQLADKTQHLFFVRHGEYSGKDLDTWGREQIDSIARQIKETVWELRDGIYICCSTAPRAEQSAEIIARKLGVDQFERNKKLWTEDNCLPKDLINHVDTITNEQLKTNSAVIIVAHYELGKSYPTHILKTRLKQEGSIRLLGKGEGAHFDLRDNTYRILSPT